MCEAGRTLRYAGSSVARHALSLLLGSNRAPLCASARLQRPAQVQQTFVRCIRKSSSQITDDSDELVESNLRKMDELFSGDGGGRGVKKWGKDPWKIKRQHYTRHVLNLTKKDKARCWRASLSC